MGRDSNMKSFTLVASAALSLVACVLACGDSHRNCAYWASIGECEVNPDWMLPNCKKSCNNCGGGGGGGGGTNQIDDTIRKLIIDKHNTLRGGVKPSAANMLKMYWNENLENSASSYAETCPNGHDSSADRKKNTGLGISVGQNLAWSSGQSYDWDGVIQSWYDEVKDFNYGGSPSGVTGHFTAMTRALTAHVGCGYKECTNNYWEKYYVCNYAYLQMSNYDATKDETQRPWKRGTPCSECGGSCADNLCDCGDKICKNGGTTDVGTCTCKCDELWKGDVCTVKNCPDKDPDNCGGPYGFTVDKCTIWTNVPG